MPVSQLSSKNTIYVRQAFNFRLTAEFSLRVRRKPAGTVGCGAGKKDAPGFLAFFYPDNDVLYLGMLKK
jgi:hypothetical protein